MSYILAIDSGNSYIKWGLSSNNCWLKRGNTYFEEVSHLEIEFIILPEPTLIIVSHVGREITRKRLCDLLSRWSVKIIWLKSDFSLCGVSNSYSNPSQLGSDRWAALVAAWHIYRDACLVIIVGTAVTIDVLSKYGRFLGGIILPSKDLMLQSLHAGTQLNGTEFGIYEDFPVSTNNAMQTGVVHCLIGAIERMHQVFSKRLNLSVDNANCIVSGGGASSLIPYIKLPLLVIDNLVLEGLVVIAEDTLLNSDNLIL